MGKGNRVRLNKAQQAAENQSVFNAKKQKKQAPAWVSTLVVVLVIALLLACVALTVVSDGGYTLRWTTIAESENYTVTGTMLSYFFYQNYSSFLNQYGSVASYLGLNTNLSLKDQTSMYGEEEGTTWFEYFMEPAVEQVKTMLVYCEEANKRGIVLDDEDYALIDEALEALREQAAEYGYTENGFISTMYGVGVKKSDVRAALELSQLATKCQTQVTEDITAAISDEQMTVYYNENAGQFMSAGVLSHTFSATEGDDAAAYETAKKDAKADADKLAAVKTAEDFKKFVLEYEAENSYDSIYDEQSEDIDPALLPDEAALETRRQEIIKAAVANALEDKGAEETKSEDKVEVMFSEIAVELTEELVATANGLLNDSFQWTDDEEDKAGLWISDEARNAFDATVIENEGKSDADDEDSKSYYTATVYMVTEPMHRDETLSRNVGHILFTSTTYETSAKAEAKAEEVLAQFKAGTVSREAFEELAKEYTEDSGVFYDKVIPGQMVVEFEDWLFDAERKEGDTGVVSTQYGYHIMYYLGENADMPAWKVAVQATMVNEQMEEWFTQCEEAVGITFNEDKVNKINA